MKTVASRSAPAQFRSYAGRSRSGESLKRAGKIDHDHLFFKETGEPIRNLQYAHLRWRRTLARLPEIRYRKPYCARHSCVSWNLMVGRSALWVARQHGHSIATMLRVYAAWTEGAEEGDLEAIKGAMAARPSNLSRSVPAPRERDRFLDRDWALDLSLARMARQLSSGNQTRLMAEREGFEPDSDHLSDQQLTDSENNSVPTDPPKSP